ncbi:MAG: hypothetical protein JWP25_9181 [Bradyrhizobium sp.]|nr:hypothetical protein [Bradyrhizobium sp.]
MMSLGHFDAIAASRGEGLHPKLRQLLERSAASASSEVAVRYDGMPQAGPGPQSEKDRVSSSQTEPRLVYEARVSQMGKASERA